jgi:hypothetical protein
MRWLPVIFCCLSLVLVAADGNSSLVPAEFDPFCRRAEDVYEKSIARAEDTWTAARKDAAGKRLKVYQDRLKEHTRAGRFDEATAINAWLDQHDPAIPPKRPTDAVRFGGHTYALIVQPVPWHVAREKCEEMGGHLVCVNSQEEENFIATLGGEYRAWTGATDEFEEGVWLNVDGSSLGYQRSRLDNANGNEHWMCWDPKVRLFDDWNGGSRLNFICEWDD